MYRIPPRRRTTVLVVTGQGDYHYEQWAVDAAEARRVATEWIKQGAGSVRAYRAGRHLMWTLTGEPERATA
jgi:hypothetical protein